MVEKFVGFLKKYKQRNHLKSVGSYIEKRNSYLMDGFKLMLNRPTAGKIYLKVGDDTMLNCSIIFESETGEVIIGDRTYIGASKIISKSKIEIGNDVFIAWDSYLYDHDSHSIDFKERQNDIQRQLSDYRSGRDFIENKDWSVVNSKPIKICSHAWIGMNCIILKGVTVGEGAIVAAGSVVVKDVPPWTVVGGNPAQILKHLPEELRKK